MRRGLIALLVCYLPALAWPAEAGVAIYRWIDGEGEVHFSQGVDSVPPRFRASALIIGYDNPPGPTAPAAPGPEPETGQVRFTPGRPIIVTARINGAGSARLVLDTGAARTLINPSVLSALGVDLARVARVLLRGVTGEAEVDAVKLESIEVGGAKYGPLLVISHDTRSTVALGDGLLGRDYLDHFNLTIDNALGVLTLTPK
jgi:predicted aspartyl protease